MAKSSDLRRGKKSERLIEGNAKRRSKARGEAERQLVESAAYYYEGAFDPASKKGERSERKRLPKSNSSSSISGKKRRRKGSGDLSFHPLNKNTALVSGSSTRFERSSEKKRALHKRKMQQQHVFYTQEDEEPGDLEDLQCADPDSPCDPDVTVKTDRAGVRAREGTQ